MKDTYIYKIGNNLYINLTNRCTNRCTFCVRNGKESYEGYPLWLKGGEPEAEIVIQEIEKRKEKFDEVVFCGFGEPTERLEAMLKIAESLHKMGFKTRLNTNGHGNAINGCKIAEKLKGKIDRVNISLNAPTREEYEKICLPQIENAFFEMMEFARDCKAAEIDAWFSVVDILGKEKIALCKKIADEVGIGLRVREYIN